MIWCERCRRWVPVEYKRIGGILTKFCGKCGVRVSWFRGPGAKEEEE